MILIGSTQSRCRSAAVRVTHKSRPYRESDRAVSFCDRTSQFPAWILNINCGTPWRPSWRATNRKHDSKNQNTTHTQEEADCPTRRTLPKINQGSLPKEIRAAQTQMTHALSLLALWRYTAMASDGG
jgi:hypothetical protein